MAIFFGFIVNGFHSIFKAHICVLHTSLLWCHHPLKVLWGQYAHSLLCRRGLWSTFVFTVKQNFVRWSVFSLSSDNTEAWELGSLLKVDYRVYDLKPEVIKVLIYSRIKAHLKCLTSTRSLLRLGVCFVGATYLEAKLLGGGVILLWESPKTRNDGRCL